MKKYKYILTAEIEVEAENIMLAEQAIHSELLGHPMIRVIGNSSKTVKTPSMRGDEWQHAKVKIGENVIKRIMERRGDKCPECGKHTVYSVSGGGEKCSSCGYWFCF